MGEKKAKADVGDVPKVYVTKYALTFGIRLCECEELDSKYGWVKWSGAVAGANLLIRRADIHHSLGAAQARAKALAKAKLRRLDKERAKMEQIVRDGAELVEEKS
jgi:hypothetical protein